MTPAQEDLAATPAPMPTQSQPPRDPGKAPPAPGMAPRVPGKAPREVGGREGPDPTRYGDWELKGRCIDF